MIVVADCEVTVPGEFPNQTTTSSGNVPLRMTGFSVLTRPLRGAIAVMDHGPSAT